ncbi:hypothetical protein LY90DRAFT_500395 [Neocallimastix californiae]|uniref:Uncharacterized protein n=1 Tax=Neocallimastix californiae TaxID=1754190 RepID=A0A1Y2FAZ2_9FUNG|nr:hypothetical protein LY90DRAFT_500395 [Neocallimastix californiae]|eukprot:ORY80614.1 hypothetical protein LY90DRAFT_500395 [Neocallimastix californiae]
MNYDSSNDSLTYYLNDENNDLTEYENDEEILEEIKILPTKIKSNNQVDIKSILERANITIYNIKGDYEIYGIDIILDSMINIVLISSLEILNEYPVSIKDVTKYINKYINVILENMNNLQNKNNKQFNENYIKII